MRARPERAGGAGGHGPPSIDRYRVLRELGRGGMGVVYAVADPAVEGRELALKVLPAGLADAEALLRFRREGEVLARVRHPAVLRVHAVGQAPEGPFIVTDLVDGEPLQAIVARGPHDPRDAARLVRDLAQGVAACHAAGVLHRDLKPGNVIVRPDGAPVLLDFGLARDLTGERLTLSGELLGTPGYMSPEQAGGVSPAAQDGRVDVWGLGAILFALLAGRPPFGAPTVAQTLVQVLRDDPPWPDLGDASDLLAVLRRALARERARRYAGADDLRADLERWLAGERPLAATRAPGARRPLAAGALLALLALGAGALALAAIPRASTPPPPPAAAPPAPRPPAPLDAAGALEEALAARPGWPRWVATRDWLAAHPRAPGRERVRHAFPPMSEVGAIAPERACPTRVLAVGPSIVTFTEAGEVEVWERLEPGVRGRVLTLRGPGPWLSGVALDERRVLLAGPAATIVDIRDLDEQPLEAAARILPPTACTLAVAAHLPLVALGGVVSFGDEASPGFLLVINLDQPTGVRACDATRPVDALAFSHDRTLAAGVGRSGESSGNRVWVGPPAQTERVGEAPERIDTPFALTFLPDGALIVGSSAGTIHVGDALVEDPDLPGDVPRAHDRGVHALHLHDRWLLSGSADESNHGGAKAWSLEEGGARLVGTWPGASAVRAIAVTPGGRLVALGLQEGGVRLLAPPWD